MHQNWPGGQHEEEVSHARAGDQEARLTRLVVSAIRSDMGRAQFLELDARGPELQGSTRQPPWLWTPLRRGGHRYGVSLLRRSHH